MADFTQTKGYGTAVYPVHASQTSGLLRRAEPMLTPEQLLSRYLKGIPLIFPNGDSFSNDELKDRIYLAMNETEMLVGRTITREAFKEKLPFDSSLYRSFIHLRAEHGPIISIEQLAIVSSDGQNVFEIPPSWIEAANFSKNLINVIPLLAAYGLNQITGTVGNAGVAFLTILDGMGWVPAYWEIKYTAGMSAVEGTVPTIVNDLVGTVAAIDLLSEIAPSNIWNSQSLSESGGTSQSSSGPGPRIYELRVNDLVNKRDTLVKKLKGIFSSKYFIDNI